MDKTRERKTSPRRGRPDDQQRVVIDYLRRRIGGGNLAPGTRLPTRDALAQRLGVSHVTVQRATHQLRDEGLVSIERPRGTFVANSPPYLNRYALLFEAAETDAEGRFTLVYQALRAAAEELNAVGERELLAYYGRAGNLAGEDIERLAVDVREHRLAGLVFFGHPHHLTSTPWWKRVPDFHHVVITGVAKTPNFIRLNMDMDAWFDRALEWLAGRGRRRASFLTPWPKGFPLDEMLQAAVRRHGLEVPTYWFQCMHPLVRMSARELIEVLFRLPAKERPDALVIADDNLVEPALAGLEAAGMRVPADVEVVAHCNYPALPRVTEPVRWLGFDAREVLERACDLIDRQRSGETLSDQPAIAPVFDPTPPIRLAVSGRMSKVRTQRS